MKKIITHRRLFVGCGGALGFLGCWGIALWSGQWFDEAFFKGAFGAFLGGWVAGKLSDFLLSLGQSALKESRDTVDKTL